MYGLLHYFTFYADKDTRLPDVRADVYSCEIFKLNYNGASSEIEIQQGAVSINSPLTDNKLQAIVGSQATLNLIATVNFALQSLYTENEKEFYVIIRRNAANDKFRIRWKLDDNPGGDLVDRDLHITVNGVPVVDAFVASEGSFIATRGDAIVIVGSSTIAWPSANNPYSVLNVSGEPSQITDDYTVDHTVTIASLDRDLEISAISYYEADFLAMRSEVFYKDGLVPYPVTYTKFYHGASQPVADANAAYDGGFVAEGEAYAEESIGAVAIWRGFIIPDNAQEPFTFPPYPISVGCGDGLGLLKNFAWTQNDGNIFLGKKNFMEVIYACMNRLGLPELVLNTCVNIYETNMTQGDAEDPFALTYVNAERYFKEDGFTPMDCEEVLKSVLEEWRATIVHSRGEFWIYRKNEAALSSSLVFRRYVGGEYTFYFDWPIDVLLGGESEGEVLAPLFHITDEVPQTMIDRPWKNSSISYRYGFVSSLVTNPNFIGWNGIVFPDWTRSDVLIDLSEDASGGAKIGGTPGKTPPYYYIFNATTIPGTQGDMFTFTLNWYNYRADGPRWAVILNSGATNYSLSSDGSWVSGVSDNVQATVYYLEGQTVVQTQPLPITGNITIRLYEATDTFDIAPSADLFITYRKADLVPFVNPNDPIGEIHVATNGGEFSFVPDMLTVFNGDDITASHVGAMFLDDLTTLTLLWVRRGLSESALATPYAAEKPFLRIAVEEAVRLYAGAFIRFEGNVFNYFFPLSRFSINLINGYFVPLAFNYDLQANKCRVTLGRVINEEVAQAYTLTSDFGETTKVTIR